MIEQKRGPAGRAEEAEPPERASESGSSTVKGRETIAAAVRTLPERPGVYRMLDARGEVLYVGKAKSLKKRVQSYAQPAGQPVRIARMVALTRSLELVVTETEAQALLLESNLIKEFKPRFNIQLRDDKSFPYILLTGDHDWPQITKHRGARNRKGEYFGPFATVGAVNETLGVLQRAFPLRSCTDSVFEGRTRPCLQYQIKRCTAPCCGRIAPTDYDALVGEVRDFLRGRSRQVQKRLSDRMVEASERLDYEAAAALRDRIRALNQIQAHREVNLTRLKDADVIAAHQEGGQTCVQIFFFRNGQNNGNRAYYPIHAEGAEEPEILGAFLGQFYQNKEIPRLVLVSHAVEEGELIEAALSRNARRRVRIRCPARGDGRSAVDLALRNAREALARRLSESESQRRLLDRLAELLDLEAPPERIEVYDNSHIMGSEAIGSMIVVGLEGFLKKAYRKFTIRQAGPNGAFKPGDDYGMMREVLSRRFSRLLKEEGEGGREGWPDLVLLDGGLGQLNVARALFEDLGLRDVALAAIAKGPQPHAGRERIYRPGKEPVMLDPRDPLLYFLQRMRDEAHRFAIGGHRAKRTRRLTRSILDQVPGIGPARKRALLHHFGSARAVADAALADLERIDGIDKAIARAIYDHFHGER